MKKQNITLGLLLLLCQTLPAQSLLYVRNGCAVNDAEMGQNHYVFDPSNEAQRIIQTIMQANFLDPNFVIKSGDVENALATVEGGQRYIIYNTTYIERIKRSGGSDWPAFYVFAHEIGHHLSNHRFDLSDNAKSKEQELKADIFAGGMLYRLGATLDQAQIGIGRDFKESGSNTHPPRSARIAAIANGWKTAQEQSGGVQPKPVVITGGSSGNSYADPLAGTFILVKGGTFTMGCTSEQRYCDDEERPTHQVTLSSYYIGQTEVTYAQWRAVMGTNPSSFENCDDCPVSVNWEEIQKFISSLNGRSGGVRYRLPTEAEWEYAARGGSQSRSYLFAGSNNYREVAWHRSNSDHKTHPVKGKKPNELGLYDMSGNLAEICSDWYGSYFSGSQTNPTGPTSGPGHVIRGGSKGGSVTSCTVSNRWPDRNPEQGQGFRLARTP